MTLTEKLLDKVADLEMQAMIFDMDIDYETLSLTPKHKHTTPFWLRRWKEKENNSDRLNILGLQDVDLE